MHAKSILIIPKPFFSVLFFHSFHAPPSQINEDPRTENLRKLAYGIILPTICGLGIIGNVLNLVVLTRRNMRGTAYIYMRGKYDY